MNTQLSFERQWLLDNGVVITNRCFKFLGDWYSIEKSGSKFYTRKLVGGDHGLSSLRRITAVYLTCSMALANQSSSKEFIKKMIDAKFVLCRQNGSNEFYSDMPVVGQGEYLFSVKVIDYIK